MPHAAVRLMLNSLSPILLMIGLVTAALVNAALLNNFEIVGTSLIAIAVFHETISKKLRTNIPLVSLPSMIPSLDDVGSLNPSVDSLFLILVYVCWGMEIVLIKGIQGWYPCSWLLSWARACLPYILLIMQLGFTACVMKVYFYVYAQRGMGAAGTSTHYATAPPCQCRHIAHDFS